MPMPETEGEMQVAPEEGKAGCNKKGANAVTEFGGGCVRRRRDKCGRGSKVRSLRAKKKEKKEDCSPGREEKNI